MAIIATDPSADPDLLLRLLRAEIARNLKADLMTVAEAQIDDVVSRAVTALEINISTALSHTHNERLIKVMLEKR